MTYIVFENPGPLDLRAVTIMGLNAKENDNPIGYFGTGFKYGIAVTLRAGCHITIQCGDNTSHPLTLSDTDFRGKSFNEIRLADTLLPFTTDLGKNWELWMAFREFYSNALDEGGTVYAADSIPQSALNVTRIIVSGGDFPTVYNERDRYFWNPNNSKSIGYGNFRSTNNPGTIFYRGIRVSKTEKPSNHSYNIGTTKLSLTEDRTLGYGTSWAVLGSLRNSVYESEDKEFITGMLCAQEGSFEHSISLSWEDADTLYSRTALELYHTKRSRLRKGVVMDINGHLKKDQQYEVLPMTPEDERMKVKALNLLRQHDITYPPEKVVWNADLGERIFGLAGKGIIYIGSRAFAEGTRCVVATFIEEYIHVKHNCDDYTREFQDITLRLLVRAMEKGAN